MDREEIEKAYWDDTLKAGSQPASVYAFCDKHGLEEANFYQHYTSFHGIEGSYWKSLVTDTVAVLAKDEDAQSYDSHQMLLAFYYTFFENVLKHRSRFMLRFPKGMSPGSNNCLKGFNQEFKKFAESLLVQAREEEAIHSYEHDRLKEVQEHGLYAQFRTLINFYRQDSSDGFEDTDAFIEKSVKFGFEAAKMPLVDSGIDLLRFALPRVFN